MSDKYFEVCQVKIQSQSRCALCMLSWALTSLLYTLDMAHILQFSMFLLVQHEFTSLIDCTLFSLESSLKILVLLVCSRYLNAFSVLMNLFSEIAFEMSDNIPTLNI